MEKYIKDNDDIYQYFFANITTIFLLISNPALNFSNLLCATLTGGRFVKKGRYSFQSQKTYSHETSKLSSFLLLNNNK